MGRFRDSQMVEALHRSSECRYDEDTNLALVDAVPEGLRLLHYTRRSIPEEFQASFAYYHDKIGDIHLDALPEPMQREVMYAVWRIVELGGRVPCAPMGLLMRELAVTAQRLGRQQQPHQSLMVRTPGEWKTELRTTWVQREKQLPNLNTLRTYLAPLDRVCKILWFAYDRGTWWEREVWDLSMDSRIPRRDHEPAFSTAIHWHALETGWLRRAAMYYTKILLEAGSITWSTAHGRFDGFRVFDLYLTDKNITTPRLCDDRKHVRTVMMDFLNREKTHVVKVGKSRGNVRSDASVSSIATAVKGLYVYMYDHGDVAAQLLAEPRWRDLPPEYVRFWMPGDVKPKGSSRRRFDERHIITDDVLSEVVKHAHIIGDPREEGGMGDPQAMRILLLMIATGRRVNEICMLDFSPLTPVAQNGTDDSSIARLRYQQTKIDGAPNTIFVDNEVVQIVAEQQQWLLQHLEKSGISDVPEYLFIKHQNNLRGNQPYYAANFRQRLNKLVKTAKLNDRDGNPLRLSATHRLRHTKATKLLDAGVPLHVVQRYLGHTSPEMTMIYAHTLDSTAKAEFVRFQKITRDGEAARLHADELYDLMALQSRTDRVLPNGWCTLPPAQACDKGNACLTCDLFVTDQRFLPVHEDELQAVDLLIDKRQAMHKDQTGEPMSEDHVWLTLRRREQGALRAIVDTLSTATSAEAHVGAGVPTRAEQDSQLRRTAGY